MIVAWFAAHKTESLEPETAYSTYPMAIVVHELS